MSSIVLVALIAAAAVLAFAYVDMFSFSRDQWRAAGRSRPAWIALTVAFGPLAVLLYWGTVRFDLQDPSRREIADPPA